jgi:hypothetical protein
MVEKSYGKRHRKGHEKGGGTWSGKREGELGGNEGKITDNVRKLGGHNSHRSMVFKDDSIGLSPNSTAPEGEQLNKLVEYVQGFSKKSQNGKKGRH